MTQKVEPLKLEISYRVTRAYIIIDCLKGNIGLRKHKF